ncbi:serine/threonine-protein phosphatase 4 regulatory subunit 2-like [Cydia fagiglandana]|uniref:serine/threonine-protein phosphatase 4 regulatory subunit 2-like n=1 Tax=Cydia fagiglandana TaxID=1458189 RepID=UPI002FEE2DFE
MMELLSQVSSTQFLFPAAAVAVVLLCAALVFIFGFHSAEQPQFDKLALVIDDKKSSNKKVKKSKEKKSSPNRSSDDAKAKSESSKKSPTKEKAKEAEKPKPKPERPAEPKFVKKDAPVEAKKGKKGKAAAETEKPADFDDGGWQEVPKKSQKKVKGPEEKEKEKKESPTKKNKNKKAKDADVEAARPVEEPAEETIKVLSVEGPSVDAEAARALQAQIEEVQRVLKEAERRDNPSLATEEDGQGEETPDDVKDLRSNKKNQNKEKQTKKKANEAAAVAKSASKEADSDSDKQDDKPNVPVFDELGDTWTDAKAKKGKKKARKDQ